MISFPCGFLKTATSTLAKQQQQEQVFLTDQTHLDRYFFFLLPQKNRLHLSDAELRVYDSNTRSGPQQPPEVWPDPSKR
ncbi:hypothetical protein CEXT_706841 [Caerostris extrusa]|uniref:Uncharacterized protein n=1 Tax=Caerostris extrusa TaxID=172846 RepID=A0AAV4PXG5_CAEEX|nr:hypothetical protein CEXT_706841 [Caerostris extrusa]